MRMEWQAGRDESVAHTCYSVPNAAGGDDHTIFACYRIPVTVTDDGMLAERSCNLTNANPSKDKILYDRVAKRAR